MKKDSLVWQIVAALILLPVIGILLGLLLRAPIESASAWFVGKFGFYGIFAGVLFVDAIPFLIDEPLLLMGYSGGLGFWPVVLVAGTASFISGPLGWLIGRGLGRFEWVQRLFERYKITPFFQRYGFWAVTIAALTPFPYALSTWAAGAAKTPIGPVLLGALFRFPKMILYLSLILLGWIAV